MRNVLSIDVEDYFQVSAFSEFVDRAHWDQFSSRVESNTQKILEILARKQVLGTFFVLGWVAERFPNLVRAISRAGHEVACHGYSHRLVYEQTPEEFREETRRAKHILEDIVGRSVVSYRAASYSITQRSNWALRILAEEGFKYDSSIFPIVHDRYGIPTAPRFPYKVSLPSCQELIEFPLSTLRVCGMNLPIAGGGYFRLLPYRLTRTAICRLNRDEFPAIFYLHPWEFDPDQPVLGATGLSRFRHYLNLSKTEPRFERLLDDFPFAPLCEVAASMQLSAEEAIPKEEHNPASVTLDAHQELPRETSKVSVIVPVYNEVENVELLHHKIDQVLRDYCCDHEIIFVDDGSTDGTYARLLKLKSHDSKLVVVKFRRNYGQTAAMQAGFDIASGAKIVTMDGDLQNDPTDVPRLIAKLDEGFDLVCGWRRHRHDPLVLRRLPSKIANWVIRLTTGVPIHDNGCSLKAYNGGLVKRLKLYGDMHRFIPAVSTLTGARVAEVEVTHHARQFGVSKYGINRVLKVMLDLLAIKVITGYASHPLLWFSITAMFFLAGGMCFLTQGVLETLDGGSPQPLAISLVGSSVLFLLSIPYLLLLGLICEIALRTGNFRQKSMVMFEEGGAQDVRNSN